MMRAKVAYHRSLKQQMRSKKQVQNEASQNSPEEGYSKAEDQAEGIPIINNLAVFSRKFQAADLEEEEKKVLYAEMRELLRDYQSIRAPLIKVDIQFRMVIHAIEGHWVMAWTKQKLASQEAKEYLENDY